ncbi:hypothetical protein OS493_000727 [Desmophyllum pertusum]|uniref:Uncharacterized protein n=1 Tax=Desmophyllum pertusum TaxID=174260 RepID=A0A9X0DCH0_9CNID|nr:hypothetical protein OS493_000727 [Desmophyllum pertusum]
MDSKTVILVFCLISAACLMSGTEAMFSQNPDTNGKRRSIPLTLESRQRILRNLCAAMQDDYKMIENNSSILSSRNVTENTSTKTTIINKIKCV